MSSLRPDPTTKIHPQPPPYYTLDHFDLLPDPLLLLILNNIADVKTLGRCSLLSKRFHSLIPQVQNVVVPVDCVISHDPATSPKTSPLTFYTLLSTLLFDRIFKPFQTIRHFLAPKTSFNSNGNGNGNSNGDVEQLDGGVTVTHHSPSQVLKGFNEIRVLKIELPSGELGLEDDVLLKWKAGFGSTLDYCVMLGASSVINPEKYNNLGDMENGNEDNGSIPESFYTDGGLKLRVVWTISSLIAASARHYLLQPIIREHTTLDSLVLTDGDGQGVLCMDKGQLEELRVKPLSASLGSKRTLVPALSMRLWYAASLELSDGMVLKGATLVAIRPSEQEGVQKEVLDGSWVSGAFEEPYGTAVRMLVKRRTYCLEMNSF